MYFRQDVLTKDKVGPEIKELESIGDYISAWVEDKTSCVREVRAYELDSHTLVYRQLNDFALTYLNFQWKGMRRGKTYQLEAQDHAGNVTRSAGISVSEKL